MIIVFNAIRGASGRQRDRLYRCIARNRYRLFGRTEQCFLPEAGEGWRFLE